MLWKKIVRHKYFILGLVFYFIFIVTETSKPSLTFSLFKNSFPLFTLNENFLTIISETFINAAVVLIFYCIIDVRAKLLTISSITSELDNNYHQFNSVLIKRIGDFLRNQSTAEAIRISSKIKEDTEGTVYSKYFFFQNEASPEMLQLIKEKLKEERIFMAFESSALINTIDKLIGLEHLSFDKKNILAKIKRDISSIEPMGHISESSCPLFDLIYSDTKKTIMDDSVMQIIKELNNDINSL